MNCAERGEAPPDYSSIDRVRGGSNQSESSERSAVIDAATPQINEGLWKKATIMESVSLFWCFKFIFWLHPFILVGCLFLSLSVTEASNPTGREYINLLQSLTPIILSIPLLAYSRVTTTDLSRYARMCVVVCLFSHLFLTLTTLCTLEDLKWIPSNDTAISYPDRSSECLNLFVHWMVSLITILSFKSVATSLTRFGTVDKILTAVDWNGEYGYPKYDKAAKLDNRFKAALMRAEEQQLESYGDLTLFFLIQIVAFSLIQIGFYCSRSGAISSVGELIFTIVVILLAIRGCLRLSKKKNLGMGVYIVILLVVVFKLIYVSWTEIEEVAGWVWLSFSHNGFRRDTSLLPTYPLVEIINPHTMSKTGGLNMTAHVARATGTVIWAVLGVTGLKQIIGIFHRFNYCNKKSRSYRF